MARAGKSGGGHDEKPRLVSSNRRASYEYELSERLECGIVLVGTEVKSLREGHCHLEAAYARIDEGRTMAP